MVGFWSVRSNIAKYRQLLCLINALLTDCSRAAHKVRPKSENLEASTVQETNEQPSTSHSMGNLLSVPRHAIDSERSIDSVPGAILSSIWICVGYALDMNFRRDFSKFVQCFSFLESVLRSADARDLGSRVSGLGVSSATS